MFPVEIYLFTKTKANQNPLIAWLVKYKTYMKHKIRSLLCDDKKCCSAYDKKFMNGGCENFHDAKGWNTWKVEHKYVLQEFQPLNLYGFFLASISTKWNWNADVIVHVSFFMSLDCNSYFIYLELVSCVFFSLLWLHKTSPLHLMINESFYVFFFLFLLLLCRFLTFSFQFYLWVARETFSKFSCSLI